MFAFGVFLVDLTAGQLLQDGAPVELEPVVFALLVYLLHNSQRLIGRDELLDELWKGTHVSDASLSRAVARLRVALGDDAREPQYIETVPRRGYRFIAAVRESAPAVAYRLTYGIREFVLTPGVHTIGRATDCGVCIESTEVSRHHARITIRGASATIEDLGSRNGTIIGSERVRHPLELRHGDVIRLGTVAITFHADVDSHQVATTPPLEGPQGVS